MNYEINICLKNKHQYIKKQTPVKIITKAKEEAYFFGWKLPE